MKTRRNSASKTNQMQIKDNRRKNELQCINATIRVRLRDTTNALLSTSHRGLNCMFVVCKQADVFGLCVYVCVCVCVCVCPPRLLVQREMKHYLKCENIKYGTTHTTKQNPKTSSIAEQPRKDPNRCGRSAAGVRLMSMV